VTGAPVTVADLDPSQLGLHLRMIFRVEDDDGTVLGQGRDLDDLKAALAPKVRDALGALGADLVRTGLTEWTIGDLPTQIEGLVAGRLVRAHPGLVDEGDTVGVALFDDPAAQSRAMWAGTRRLLQLTTTPSNRALQGRLGNDQRLALGRSPYAGGFEALVADAHVAVLDGLLRDHGGPVWDEAGFAALRRAVRAEVADQLRDLLSVVARIVVLDRSVGRRLDALRGVPATAAAVEDMDGQRAGLVYDGFVVDAGRDRVPDLERYLRAMVSRLEKLGDAPRKDAERMASVHRVATRYTTVLDEVPPGSSDDVVLEDIGWAIEELRVSLFAQTLGTSRPVSEARLSRALQDVAARRGVALQ
jgi:ATP-dependent helicase HrpA